MLIQIISSPTSNCRSYQRPKKRSLEPGLSPRGGWVRGAGAAGGQSSLAVASGNPWIAGWPSYHCSKEICLLCDSFALSQQGDLGPWLQTNQSLEVQISLLRHECDCVKKESRFSCPLRATLHANPPWQ